jgi:glycerophosphoryl diester phosphodiesterase
VTHNSRQVSWVAHRGDPVKYPENTLPGYRAAMEYGARYVELDIQLTADEVPVLLHDINLLRMSGIDQDIVNIHVKDLENYPASHPERFGNKFLNNRFCSLEEFANWFSDWPDATVFVEIKAESVRHFGVELVVEAVYRSVESILGQCVVISFDDAVVERARTRNLTRFGWVLPRWGTDIERRAGELEPGFLFCDKELLPEGGDTRWDGTWEWVIYNLDDPVEADEMIERGLRYLETNCIGEMLERPGKS